ncbi:hypothetical protein AB0J74_09925 [Asanoa sp. NPDC049573]|uniref:hypothetical protein n=1 Tax=Asanoa sp. NPDC049573 TaxID=3155396 RepID=UPI003445448D
MVRRRPAYGAGAPHAVVLLGCFTIAGWAVFLVSGEATVWRMALWFVGAAIAHDLVLFPVYAAVDRRLRRATRTDLGNEEGRPGRAAVAADRVAVLNHIRVPALGAALLFLVFLPGILNLGDATYAAATGEQRVSYAIRWLWVSGALFLLSGLVLAVRLARRR